MAQKKKSSGGGAKGRVLLCAMILTSVAILPTTVIFFIGMMPTIADRVDDKTRQRTRTMTIGFMNFAACFPFWFELMKKGHTFDNAVSIIMDPSHVVIMYGGALGGYLIEWSLSGFVAGLMAQKGQKRLETIKKLQEDLVQRWGREVTGEIPLDMYGFPVESKEK
jgi:hypothetical protein